MRERTKVPIVTFALAIKIGRAKLCLVLVWMVELLDSVVRLVAVVPVWAVLMLVNVRAFLGLVETERSSPVLLVVVIEGAALEVVSKRITGARHRLK